MTDTAMVPRKYGRQPAPLIDEQLADQLLGRAQAEGVELLGLDGLLSRVTKAVLERALAEEMTEHLGFEKHDPAGRGSGNSRNGTTGKTLSGPCPRSSVRSSRSGPAEPPRALVELLFNDPGHRVQSAKESVADRRVRDGEAVQP
jgi:Transposase, Mutator family